jgi:hypothetical protein
MYSGGMSGSDEDDDDASMQIKTSYHNIKSYRIHMQTHSMLHVDT